MPAAILTMFVIIWRTAIQRERIFNGQRSENHGNQQTLMNDMEIDEMPTRKISSQMRS